MALVTKQLLDERIQRVSGYISAANQREFAVDALLAEKKSADVSKTYDIFLSHSYHDARIIKALRDELVDAGFTVYVDWIEDNTLSRDHVSKFTAEVIRGRMNRCRSLLYATSDSAKKSVWMPWELGYMDGLKNRRVAVAPIVEESEKNNEFKGREYLGIYPYLDLTGEKFYIHESNQKWVGFKRWISGDNPEQH